MASSAALTILAHCDAIAGFTEDPPNLTRTFLSGAARSCNSYLIAWMDRLGMQTRTDAAGNVRGFYHGADPAAGTILIGSHTDTVPNAGRYDGVLGVVLALTLVQQLNSERLPIGIEVVAFSEEEGVRFGTPFIGSRALMGDLDPATLAITDASGISLAGAIRAFGLPLETLPDAVLAPHTRAYLEFHIEQGPLLERLGAPLGIVEAIAGQTRGTARFVGHANHAGTTPMQFRHDALCAAAEWILAVEASAKAETALVATVGSAAVKPGAGNVVPGQAELSLDIRHANDSVRAATATALIDYGHKIADKRQLHFQFTRSLDQAAVPMHPGLTARVENAIQAIGLRPHRMTSGAGHDAMIIARRVPSAMIFLRTPKGISHHPDEAVQAGDVDLALRAGLQLLKDFSRCPFTL